MKCIWCKRNHQSPSIEHIIPESLGCPEGLILTNGEVCKSCNNRLGNIDRALLHQFEIQTFLNGIPRKGGKPPSINSIRNIKGEFIDGKPVYTINMDTVSVKTPSGQSIAGFRRNSSAVDATFKRKEHLASVTFDLKTADTKKVNRALTKIALGSIAKLRGVDSVLNESCDYIREYVLHGGTNRPVLWLRQADDSYRNQITSIIDDGTRSNRAVRMIIAGMGFIVDLSEDLSVIDNMKKTLESDSNYDGWWSYH